MSVLPDDFHAFLKMFPNASAYLGWVAPLLRARAPTTQLAVPVPPCPSFYNEACWGGPDTLLAAWYDNISTAAASGGGFQTGHRVILHGCTIGDNSLVGMGATILNGATIGRNSLIGANALVTEGKSFPDNSLIVGSPARAVRELDADAIAGLRQSAENYIANWKRFSRDLGYFFLKTEPLERTP